MKMRYAGWIYWASAIGVFAACAASTVDVSTPPPKPRLSPNADVRDARAYYEYGIENIVEHPDLAAEAFYWASRLDPTWAAPLYARWASLHLQEPRRLRRYTDGDERVIWSPEVMSIDSLAYRAYQLDPTFFRRLTYLWNETWWRQSVLNRHRGLMPYSTEELNFILDSLLTADTTTSTQGWLAYSNRQFRASLGHYRKLLSDDEYDNAEVHAWRGHIFHIARQYDSARVSFENSLEELRQKDEEELVIMYESKAMMEYRLGISCEAMGDVEGATEAYSRALLEDLSFYPAHQRLGQIALASADTATAILEFEMAAESDPTIVVPHLWLGRALYLSGRPQEAIVAIQKVIDLEPIYAEPYFVLALSQEAIGDQAGALLSYHSFNALAKASDDRRPGVAERIAALSGGEATQ